MDAGVKVNMGAHGQIQGTGSTLGNMDDAARWYD